MPNDVIVQFVDRIEAPVTPLEFPAEEAPLTVVFRSDQTALLDPGHPDFAEQRDLLNTLIRIKRPAYVEVRPENRRISRVEYTVSTRVRGVTPLETGDVHVRLDGSAARHTIGTSTPEDLERLRLLREALESGTEVSVAADPDANVIVDVRPLAAIVDAALLPPKPLSKAAVLDHVSQVEWDQARELFDILRQQSCTLPLPVPKPTDPVPVGGCIPFLCTEDFCWAMTHRVCAELAKRHITPGKIWIFGNLRIKTPNSSTCVQHWDYHVATFLRLAAPSGTPRLLVLDPEVFFEKGPVLEEEWRLAVGHGKESVDYTLMDIYRQSQPRDDDSTSNPSDMDGNLELARRALRRRSKGHASPPPYPHCQV